MPFRRSTLSRLIAILLVALAASPFTPPFVTCGLDAGNAGGVDLVTKQLPHNDPLVMPGEISALTTFLFVVETRPAPARETLPRPAALHDVLRL